MIHIQLFFKLKHLNPNLGIFMMITLESASPAHLAPPAAFCIPWIFAICVPCISAVIH